MVPTISILDFTRKVFSTIDAISRATSDLDNTKRNQLRLLNYFGIAFALGFSLILFSIAVFVTIPFTFGEDYDSISLWRYITIYSFLSYLANYFLMWFGAVKSIQCSPADLPMHSAGTREDWMKCKRCDQDVPPRSHHCPLCDMCILKRDHHCFFAGVCIGFHNQRYFICCAFHTLLSSAISFYFLTAYLGAHYVTFLGPEFFKYFLPYAVVVWLFGSTTFSIFLYILVFYFNFTTIVAAIFYLLWQFNLVWGGQTSFEFVKGKKTYQSKILTHVRSVFGPFWILNFIFPMPWFKNEGNGRTWASGSTKFM